MNWSRPLADDDPVVMAGSRLDSIRAVARR
jgi:hypothetical protein